MCQHDTQFFLDLESKVWAAQVSGDGDADRRLLSSDFLGVYPSGVATRTDHVQQLSDGPVMRTYALSQAQLIAVSPTAVLLSYRADFQRPAVAAPEAMFVSSLWRHIDGRWQNTFSQDTPASA